MCAMRIGKIPPALRCASSQRRLSSNYLCPRRRTGKTIRTQWYHPDCIFKSFVRMTKSTKTIRSTDDLHGFHQLRLPDQQIIADYIVRRSKVLVDAEQDEDRREAVITDYRRSASLVHAKPCSGEVVGRATASSPETHVADACDWPGPSGVAEPPREYAHQAEGASSPARRRAPTIFPSQASSRIRSRTLGATRCCVRWTLVRWPPR